MEQAGEFRIAADRSAVWAALNDPEVLKRCIDGCQSMQQTSETTFVTAVKAKIGPVSALFKADLQLDDIVPPNSYTIHASAKGGAAGFGKGTANVQLADITGESAGTLLTYSVTANVGGKLAQIGSRLIDGAARKMADDFFSKFALELGGEVATAVDETIDEAVVEAGSDAPQGKRAAEDYQPSQQWVIWAIMLGVLLLAVVLTL